MDTSCYQLLLLLLFFCLLPVATGGHKLTVFSFSGCYRLLPVATGGQICRYQLLLLLFFLFATGRYRWIQAVASAFHLLPAGYHYVYMRIAVLFLSIYCYSKGFHPLDPINHE